MTTAYPLAWPQGFPRNKGFAPAKTKTSVNQAVLNVMTELRRFGNDSSKVVSGTVISSNVTLTDGRPSDPGVACYFIWDGIQCCIAVDRYHWPEENLQAIALIIEAERTKIRHGGLNIVRAAFRGYASLPPPSASVAAIAKPWREVLGVTGAAKLPDARAAYVRLVKTSHPDAGGNAAVFNLIVDAWRQAQEELAA